MTSLPTRRSLLRTGLAAGIALPLASAGQDTRPVPEKSGKTMLVLGGTRFVGPAVVDAALARGYEVTLFNRGQSNPHLYPELEKLRGDRNTNDLASLEGRKFDTVVDPSCYLPRHAEEMAKVLGENVGHYLVISSISAYSDQQPGYEVDEDGPVGTITEEGIAKVTTIQEVMLDGGIYYGPLKALSESKLEELMPGRVTSLRPGVICGRDDPSDRLPYWVKRVSEGGEILCPGDPNQGLQFTDVLDLGQWCVDFCERRVGGVFNAIGFNGSVSLQELLHGCKIVLGRNDARFTWVNEEFLLGNQVRPFSEMPFWLPEAAAHHYSPKRGIEAGMTFRPISETIRNTMDWWIETRDVSYSWRYYGMAKEREAALLSKWNEQESGTPSPLPEPPKDK
jgi:2'-hydroxyisoflavone reductase